MSFGNEQPWMVSGEEAHRIIRRAVDLGVNYFDTADVYSDGLSEEILGRALEGQDEFIVATKVGLNFGPDPTNTGLAPDRVRRQATDSMRRLRRRSLDLYQIHRWDYKTPIRETLRVLDELVREQKVRHLGASSMFAWQFMQALDLASAEGLARFETMQNRYNLVYREEEREMIPLCRQLGIALVPYSPLAMGFLSGKYSRDKPPNSIRYRTSSVFRDRYFFDNDFSVLESLREVAARVQATPAQVALAWLLGKPGVSSVIVGATRPEQLDDAVASLDVRLSKEDVLLLESRYVPHQLIGPIPLPS